ncbi:hypothetical protein [Paenibacillus methanolicus]|uniref:hypothetical protein n=1 Tax=Paenibacillus methanolicus TaxID=582686 RepID=UPI0011E6A456|nr:hypothetical protein [Paenibacillus methanolicus]
MEVLTVDATPNAQLYVMTARIPAEGVDKFNAYESHVLPLLGEHGARLERRLQSRDRLNEVHIIWFPSPKSFENYRTDPRRTEYAYLLVESGAAIELRVMKDVSDSATNQPETY